VAELGRIPEVGDAATLHLQPVASLTDDDEDEPAQPVAVTATVTAMDRRRVDRLRLVVQSPDGEPTGNGAGSGSGVADGSRAGARAGAVAAGRRSA